MITKRTQFYFIRHGQTDSNRLGVYSGSTDVPLNELGRLQAQQAAIWLQNHPIKSIAVSPLLRAFETAHIIGNRIGITPVVIHELQECSLGVMEGQPHGDILWSEYAQQWRDGFTHEGGEPFQDFMKRIVSGVDQALALEGPVLVVAHGAMGTALVNALGHDHISFDNATPYHFRPQDNHEFNWHIQRMEKHDFDDGN